MEVRSNRPTNSSRDSRQKWRKPPYRDQQSFTTSINWSRVMTHANPLDSSGFNAFRQAARPLADMESSSLEWMRQASTSDSFDRNTELAHIQNSVWESFVERDRFMDRVKKFNTSNIELLRQKIDHEKDMRSPAHFEVEIRRCMENPGGYPQTWELIQDMVEEQALAEYLKNRAVLNAGELDNSLVQSMQHMRVGEPSRPSKRLQPSNSQKAFHK
uniref:RGS domain-containing protein n=1 Tax=Ditylenchus dipsaci TaxID=166011 RepID=A0A915CML4_9BILA